MNVIKHHPNPIVLYVLLSSFSTLSLQTNAVRSAATMTTKPPMAKKVAHTMELFGDVRVDNYYWLRDDTRSSPEVLSYLQQENAYTQSLMSTTKKFEDEVYAEIRGRIKEDDVSAPVRRGPYYYYSRTLKGKEYVQHCRRLLPNADAPPSVHDTMPTGPDAPQEHIILDENLKAQSHDYYSIGAFKVNFLSFFFFNLILFNLPFKFISFIILISRLVPITSWWLMPRTLKEMRYILSMLLTLKLGLLWINLLWLSLPIFSGLVMGI